MGTLTGTQFAYDIRDLFGDVETKSYPSEAQVLRNINSAYINDICALADLSELDTTDTEATVASTATTAFSVTDVLAIKGIVDNNGIPLKEITANEYDRLWARTGAITGVPTHWYRTGATTSGTITIRWYPVPNAAYTMTMNYRDRPAVLTASTATAIDSLYDEPLLYFAAARIAARMRMFDTSVSFKKYAQSLLAGAAASQMRSSEYLWSMGGMEEMS
jgi:hypothetical protein